MILNRMTPSIQEVISRPEKYRDYPPCQRDFVWSMDKKQQLIDSVLRGLPIGSILVAIEDGCIGALYWIVDGQQRLESLRAFAKGEFRTASRFRKEPSIKPIAPKSYYYELNATRQANFNDYLLQIDIVPAEDMELMFRRIQIQEPLSTAEKLWTYSGDAKEQGGKVINHSFWETIYKGVKKRRQTYQCSLICMVLELYDGHCNTNSEKLYSFASGCGSKQIPSNLYEIVCKRLDQAEHVFAGARVTDMNQMIAIYQAVHILESNGYALNRSEEGCLAEWFNQTVKKAKERRRRGELPYSLWTRLQKVYEQFLFWGEHFPQIIELPGLLGLDEQRRFSFEQKIRLYEKQQGACPVCNNPVDIGDVGHHITPWSEGGPTTIENGVLVHTNCHQQAILLGAT